MRTIVPYYILIFTIVCSKINTNKYFVIQRKERIMATNKVTSAKAASAASKVLRDGRTSKASKTAAGSALSQRPSKKK